MQLIENKVGHEFEMHVFLINSLSKGLWMPSSEMT